MCQDRKMMAHLGNFKNFKMTVKDIQAPPLEKLNHKTMGTLFCYLLVSVTCLLLRYHHDNEGECLCTTRARTRTLVS